METFEKHIVKVLNRRLYLTKNPGEFFFVKNYKPGNPKLYKDVSVRLVYKHLDKVVTVILTEVKMPVQTNEMDWAYDEVFEELLYKLMFDEEIWNSISIRLQLKNSLSRTRMQEEL